MLSLSDYCQSLGDRVRNEAYAAALARRLTGGSVVLNVDAGIGLASLLACQLGAGCCYAVDSSSIVRTLTDTARENGFADRLLVVEGSWPEIELPARADVIVSDVPGPLPIGGAHLANLLQARERYLASGGHMLPQTDVFSLAVVSAPSTFEERRRPWQAAVRGLNLRSALPLVDNRCDQHRARPDELLCSPAEWARIDYGTFTSQRVRGSVKLTVDRAGTGHGLLAWYERILAPGVGYSNAPGAREGDYRQMLFPWPEPVRLDAGDVVEVDLRGDPVGPEYLWTWATRVHKPARTVVASYRQSTFFTLPVSPDALRKRAETFVPSLSTEGELVRDVLKGIGSAKSVRALAEELLATRPRMFRSLDEAHGFVAGVSERYGC